MSKEVDAERERIMSELMEYSYAGLVKIAAFKLKNLIYPPEPEPQADNLLSSSNCGCGGNCGCGYHGA